MNIPKNTFKQALYAGKPQIGLWHALASPYSAEILAGSGFDWLLLDGEHAPNDCVTILPQLQAMNGSPCHPIVRPPEADARLIKQYLDIGVQTLLLPMIDTAEQAENCVKAMHYPPHGIRGIGSALARASRWNRVDNYLHEAEKELCCIIQIERVTAVNNLAEILKVDGVDALFIGPADLSASLGYLGQPNHVEVKKVIADCIKQIQAANKFVGILDANVESAKNYLANGINFIAVGTDVTILARTSETLAQQFKDIKTTNKYINNVY